MGFPLSGPAYWDQTFGIASFEEFQSAVGKYVDGIGVFGFQPPTELVEQLAYNSPYAGLGGYLAARLAAAGYVGTDNEQSTSQVAGSLVPLFIGTIQQETSMAALVVPNCFQVAIQMTAGGHVLENVVGVENSSGTASGAAAAVKAAWEVASGPLTRLSSGVAVTNYHAVDIGSTTGAIVDLASTATGSSGSTSFSTRAACALVKWNGTNRSRSTRGRLYLGPIGEADINSDGATLVTASRTATITAFTNFRNSLAAAGYPLVVLSRKDSSATLVSSHDVETTIATQRRRLR